MNETDDGPKIYVAGDAMHYWLDTPSLGYAPFMTRMTEKVNAVFWTVDQIVEKDKWGGGYQEMKLLNGDMLGAVKGHWDFVKPKVFVVFQNRTVLRV